MASKKVVDVEAEEKEKAPKKVIKKEEKKEELEKIEVKEEVKKSNDEAHKVGLVYALVTFVICLVIFAFVYEFYLKNLVVETTKLVKDVTITDKGIADAVEKVYDSVVVIQTYRNGKTYSGGTGFVYKKDDKKAYIITNHHVVDSSDEVRIKFSNEKVITAKVVGTDEYADIAVLSVDADNVKDVASIGKSVDMRVGDTTFTVGAPIDSETFSWSVTRGILSGKNRVVETEDNVIQVLQTDAAINSGNSGGPLCNSNGEVIGVTNMKLASSSIEGMGFAIPIEDAVKYAESIITGKEIVRPYIGVSIYDASKSFFSFETGVFINYVEKGGAASKAGLEKGDKILSVNGKEVTSTATFKYELYKHEIGDKVEIKVERDGKEKTFTVTLGASNGV